MNISQYIEQINKQFQTGFAREHSYHPDLQNLLVQLTKGLTVTNEPARIQCGAPDFVLSKNDIPIGYIEAKDINDNDLEGKKTNKEQFNRYKKALNNIIFTDYLNFLYFKEGKQVTQIRIAEVKKGKIISIPEAFAEFERLIREFSTSITQSIKDPLHLAEVMANKAQLIKDAIHKAVLNPDKNLSQDASLVGQMETLKKMLIKDLTSESFADVYAQTIVYGLFSARFHDTTLETFSRMEVAQLLPQSNSFLRQFFQNIASFDVDARILWTLDDLIEIFRASDVKTILKKFGSTTGQTDPIIHFYENFLTFYDPKLRKSRGVWYTPEPVVNFIIRAVDDILKTEFNLKKGLADTSKVQVNDTEFHKVQILDPATGTGTFLAETVKHIYNTEFENIQGAWSNYVQNDLIPRLNGFELLIASYVIAHLKLDMLFQETGFTNPKKERFRVFLTNSLEEPAAELETLFSQWLVNEAQEARKIKEETPVMCIIGNPPYSGESANKGKWIMNLMKDYKKEPNTKQKLKERNPKWINDDYVKFMRYGQYFIEKNGSGILAFINPHGFLDNTTFRGMRWNLLKTYDKIYTIDLHGNNKKKETTPDGSIDQNVFDIMQGVSINILVKTGEKKAHELGKVFHYDLYGKREVKYDFLVENSIKTVPYKELSNKAPMYFMVQKDFEAEEKYEKGFSIPELFKVTNVGIATARDKFVIDENKEELETRIKNFFRLSTNEILAKYDLRENKSWKIGDIKSKPIKFDKENITPISYRPFDNRFVYYHKAFIERNRNEVMKHFLNGNNVGLVIGRQGQAVGSMPWNLAYIINSITDLNIYYRGGGSLFPLYLYPNINMEKEYCHQVESCKVRYKEAQIIAENFEETFDQIQKMYEKTENPNEELTKYYIQQKRHYTKIQNTVKKYKQELSDKQTQHLFKEDENKKIPNLDKEITDKIAKKLGLKFTKKKENQEDTFAPIDILDYIYAVLYSPSYRKMYKEFLKIDFPRVPYPDQKTFWDLVKLGGKLRQIHLLESEKVKEYISSYPKNGSNEITRKLTKKDWELTGDSLGRIWINDEQYFDRIPLVAWEFYIGGYQPAQKWLKDRRGRKLDFDDIKHYLKIIVALNETHQIMQKIDQVFDVKL